MNIQGNKPPEKQDVNRSNIDRIANKDAKPNEGSGTSPAADRVNISNQGKEVADLMARLEKIPNVREEKIDAIRQAIQSGTYEVDARKIAEKILNEL